MRTSRFLAAALGALLVATLVLPASAMPGFARKYRLSCTACHAPFPNLKDFGNEFAARGFRMEDPSQEPARATHETGDPLLTLFREVPLGFRMEGFAAWKEDATAETDLEWPWTWKIISGGPLSDNAAYYFYFLVERGEVVGLEDAYVQLNTLFGAPVSLLAGQFQVSDPMFKREARLEKSDYLIYKATVGESSLDITYDRGIVLGTDTGPLGWTLQVVNGNGIPHADDERNFDHDKFKNVALHVGGDVGPVNLGLFGYWGKQRDEMSIDNETWYFGPNATVPYREHLVLNFQYLERRDDNPFFTATKPENEVETRGGFGELHVYPAGYNGRWVFTGLYNWVDSDDETARRETASLTVNYLLARNLRLLTEGGHDLELERSFVTMGLVAAF
jgi:hypothetical protein